MFGRILCCFGLHYWWGEWYDSKSGRAIRWCRTCSRKQFRQKGTDKWQQLVAFMLGSNIYGGSGKTASPCGWGSSRYSEKLRKARDLSDLPPEDPYKK